MFSYHFLSGAMLLCAAAHAASVTIAQDASAFTLSNGYLTARVNKTTGDLLSLKVRDSS
jgi:hypothetical protein